ncbi:histidine phosphatase family protein [Pseudarthrobacter sp. S9]|uniref:histidine phosphatase family protein n=1 Tax=Pseudarthrobacter sp. S9 TaxID=3418421 RepID=UPI003CFD5277
MKTLLTLVRHGETVWHAENRYAGSRDVALTPRGREQAAALARWAATADLTSIRSSDLSRARLTAEGCAAAAGHQLTIDPRLRELDFGQGEGLTPAEMRQRFPEARKAFQADPVGHHLPGGENPVIAAERFTGALKDAAAADPGGHILVVAHTTAIRLALCRLLGIPLGEYRRAFPSLGNCALSTIRVRDGETGLLRYNSPLGPAAVRSPAPPAAGQTSN